jgi:hypothetical protein
MVIVLAIEHKVREFKPDRGRWIFMGIKIRNITSFAGEVKPAVPCSYIIRHFKDPYSKKETLSGHIHGQFSPKFTCSATRCPLVTARELR